MSLTRQVKRCMAQPSYPASLPFVPSCMQDYLAYCQERVDGALVAAAAQQGGVQPSSLEVQEGVGGLLQRLSQAGSTVGELSLLPGLGTDRLGSVLGGGGVLGSLPSRARRWPSVAVTTYPQVRAGVGRAAGQGALPAARARGLSAREGARADGGVWLLCWSACVRAHRGWRTWTRTWHACRRPRRRRRGATSQRCRRPRSCRGARQCLRTRRTRGCPRRPAWPQQVRGGGGLLRQWCWEQGADEDPVEGRVERRVPCWRGAMCVLSSTSGGAISGKQMCITQGHVQWRTELWTLRHVLEGRSPATSLFHVLFEVPCPPRVRRCTGEV